MSKSSVNSYYHYKVASITKLLQRYCGFVLLLVAPHLVVGLNPRESDNITDRHSDRQDGLILIVG